MKTKSVKQLFWLILIAAVIVRFAFMFWATPLKDYNYWEYGTIAKNMHADNGMAFYHYDAEGGIRTDFDAEAKPFPSALMPPLYVFYLYPFLFIEDDLIRNICILGLQNLSVLLLLFMLYKTVSRFFNQTTALISIAVTAFLPEFIYASNTYGPLSWYFILVVSIIYLLSFNQNKKSLIIAGVLSGLCILLRSEFLLFVVLSGLVILKQFTYKGFLAYIIPAIFILLPWQVRNYMVFDQFVLTTTNSGLNLYRGHNPYGIGSWGTYSSLFESIAEDKRTRGFELHANDKFKSKAIEHIQLHPLQSFKNAFIKLAHLWGFNPSDERAKHPLYLIPWFMLLTTALIGLKQYKNKQELGFIFVFLLHLSLSAAIFFALARYQTMLKIWVIPLSAYAIYLGGVRINLWRRCES